MRIGILGAGGMGNVHARHYQNIPGVELTIFEPIAEKSAEYAAKWNATQADSYDSLLKQVDVVDICLPTNLHFENGRKAIASGKTVFMEKPLAGNLKDAAILVEESQKAGVPFAVGHVVRYFAEYKKAHDVIASGAIGNPASARTRRGGLAPKSPWFQDYEASGGVILDLAIHDFDWLRWTLGEVILVTSRSTGLSNGTWPDYSLTTLSFESGAVSHTEATWMDPAGFRVTFSVSGTEGMIEHDSRKTQILKTTTTEKPTANESPLHSSDDPFFKQLSAFVDSIRSGSPVPVSAEEGFKSLAVALAAVESARTGKSVRPTRA